MGHLHQGRITLCAVFSKDTFLAELPTHRRADSQGSVRASSELLCCTPLTGRSRAGRWEKRPQERPGRRWSCRPSVRCDEKNTLGRGHDGPRCPYSPPRNRARWCHPKSRRWERAGAAPELRRLRSRQPPLITCSTRGFWLIFRLHNIQPCSFCT